MTWPHAYCTGDTQLLLLLPYLEHTSEGSPQAAGVPFSRPGPRPPGHQVRKGLQIPRIAGIAISSLAAEVPCRPAEYATRVSTPCVPA